MYPRSETNTDEQRRAILKAAADRFGSGRSRASFERGQWFVYTDDDDRVYEVFDTASGFGFRRSE